MSLTLPLIALLFAVLPQAAVAQTIATFEEHHYPDSRVVLGQADLNGDGRLDLITTGASGQSFGIQLGNGDGTFHSPVDYATGTGEFAQSIAVGDFTGDAKVDIAITTNQHALYLFRGNGDGTFQTPTKLIGTGVEEVVAADANGDGRMDLVAHIFQATIVAPTPVAELLVFLNNGDGTFTMVNNSIPVDSEPGDDGSPAFLSGDFDGDGHVDVAIAGAACGESACRIGASLYFGDGAGHFTYGNLRLSSGSDGEPFYDVVDVDGDGKDEIVIMRGRINTSPAAVFVASVSSTRQVTYKETDLADDIRGGFDFTHDYGNVADFNLDGFKDILLAVNRSADGKPAYIILPGKGDGTFSAPQYISANVGRIPWAGDYKGDGKPDFLNNLFDSNFQPITLQVMVNTTEKGTTGCSAPEFAGIQVCSPQQGLTYSSPLSIKAAANLNTTIYRFELWVDNVKLVTVRDSNVMDTQLTLNPGPHKFVFVARNADGTERYTKTVTASVSQACGPPSTVGINVCSPADASTVTSPVNIEAYAKVSGTIYRFELWVDSVKMVTIRDSGTMKGSLTLPTGHHQFDFVARNTDSTSRTVKTVFITVQ